MAAPGTRSSGSSEEKNTTKTFKKPTKVCYMHLINVKNEQTQDFTAKRWETFRNCVEQWLGLSGDSKTIAETYKHCLNIDFENLPDDAGFHGTCYRRFIDRRRLDSTEKRKRRHPDFIETQGGESVLTGDAAGSTSETPRKRLRSRTGLPIVSTGPVLPALCIICKNVHKCITVSGKRSRDHVTRAQTLTAGLLLQAAEMKEDTAILLHIKDKDCVAMEVRYHKSCYRQYTRFLTKLKPAATDSITTEEETIMKRLPSRSASSEASNTNITLSSSEVQALIEQEVHTAVTKNETKLQGLIETIQQLDQNFESSMQTLEARMNAVTKRAEEAIAHMTKAQKKSQLPCLSSEDEAMETTSPHINKKNLDKKRKLCEMVETTKEALKKMQADNEALKAAMADLSETPPPVPSPHGSPGLKHVGLIKTEPEDDQEMSHFQESECEEPTPKRLKVEDLSCHDEHADTEKDALSFPPLPETTFPSIMSMEVAKYNLPSKPEVHLGLIRNPPGLSVLWKVDDHDDSAPPMDCYNVFMTMEKVKGSGIFRKWTSLGELKPLPMPMCVMVNKYKPGLKVCVAVVGKDTFGRHGPYSRIVTAAIPEEKMESS